MVTRVQRAQRAWLLLAAVALCCAVLAPRDAYVCAEYTAKDDVVILTDKNFEKEVLNSGDYWLVEFYAPWCGHCQKLEPEYKAAAKKLKKHARFGAINADEYKSLAQKYQIKGFPTIKEFGAKKKKPKDYQGGRTKNDIVQYVKNSEEAKKLGVSSASITTLEFSSVHTFLTQNEKVPSAIFFGSVAKKTKKKASGKSPSWLSSVAEKFMKGKKKKKPTVQIGFVPGSEDKIAKHFGIEDEKLPAVVFVNPSGTKFVVSDIDSLNEAKAKEFISKSLQLDDAAIEALASVPLFPSPEVAKKKPKTHLNRLDENSMRDCLKKKGKMCVVIAKPAGPSTDEMLKTLAKVYRRDPFKFLVSEKDAVIFRSLASFLGAQESEVIVLKPGRKVKYSTLPGSNDETAIGKYLDKIIDGSIPFSPITIQDSDVNLDLSGSAAASTKTDDEPVHEEL
uniref:Thioredoxin domain-containing protein n=1 Tax=Globisporangium ultimum (strain ATCC 200006 / CBS 805.95 / DAOM BR144) TaxID=431595 RepID=K3X2P9_GLOUD